MKQRVFFIFTIVIGSISFQGIYFAKERISHLQQQKGITQESLEQHKEVTDYVNEMVEFPTEHTRKPLAKVVFFVLMQILSQRKILLMHYIATIKSLYYYIMGSFLGIVTSVFDFFRSK